MAWRRGAEFSQDGSAWRWWSVIVCVCAPLLMLRCSRAVAKKASTTQKGGGTDGSAELPPRPGRCRHWRRSALDGGCYSLLQSVHQVGCGEGGARQMHSGLPSADATVTRCSPQRATARPSPAAMRPRQPAGTAPTRVLSMLLRHVQQRRRKWTHAKPVCWAGGGVGLLPAALRDRGQTRRPRSAVALARRVEHGSCLPVAGQDLELLRRKLCQRRAGQRADRRRQSPSRGCVRSTPGRLGTTMRTHLHSTTNVPNGRSWSCTAWQDLCVGVRLAGLPGGGFEEWRARAWPFACARAAGRRARGGAAHPRRGRAKMRSSRAAQKCGCVGSHAYR